jgi:hypothetical protein
MNAMPAQPIRPGLVGTSAGKGLAIELALRVVVVGTGMADMSVGCWPAAPVGRGATGAGGLVAAVCGVIGD